MTLADGSHDVPPGKIATVITHLEMRARADTRPVTPPEGWELVRHTPPDRDWYLNLFHAVGAPWLWFGRAVLEPEALDAILNDPKVFVFSLRKDGQDGGLLELDFRTPGQCELAYFGLVPSMVGTGAGRYMMNFAIDTAWTLPITRFHLHTCTLDSPQALRFYRRSGFQPVKQQIGIADDPRLALGYDRAFAPHVPIFDR